MQQATIRCMWWKWLPATGQLLRWWQSAILVRRFNFLEWSPIQCLCAISFLIGIASSGLEGAGSITSVMSTYTWYRMVWAIRCWVCSRVTVGSDSPHGHQKISLKVVRRFICSRVGRSELHSPTMSCLIFTRLWCHNIIMTYLLSFVHILAT